MWLLWGSSRWRLSARGGRRDTPDVRQTCHSPLSLPPVTKSRYYGDGKILRFMDQTRNVHYDLGRMQQQN